MGKIEQIETIENNNLTDSFASTFSVKSVKSANKKATIKWLALSFISSNF